MRVFAVSLLVRLLLLNGSSLLFAEQDVSVKGYYKSDGTKSHARGSEPRLLVHERPAGFLEVSHDVAAAALAVASFRRRPLMDSATIHLPPVEDHVVLALADKFHVGIGAWFRA